MTLLLEIFFIMTFLPAGKRAAITGAGGGIGRSLALALARRGARSILALDQNLDGARETAELINAAAPSCTVEAEVCDASDRNSLVSALTAHRTTSGELRRPIDLFCVSIGDMNPEPHDAAAAAAARRRLEAARSITHDLGRRPTLARS